VLLLVVDINLLFAVLGRDYPLLNLVVGISLIVLALQSLLVKDGVVFIDSVH